MISFCGTLFLKAYPIFDLRTPEQKVVELETQGRMGNLMFQYASALSYALEHDKKLYIFGDISELERAFGLKINYATEDNPVLYTNFSEEKKKSSNVVQKDIIDYEDAFETDSSYGLLFGFFQDPRFFQKHQTEVRKAFTFNKGLSPENKKLIEELRSVNSVSVHIRRGDYVEKKDYHFLLTNEYYERAADYIAERVKDPHFYIFSDDLEWVKKNIKLKYPHTFVEANQFQTGYNDMRLMSLCRHNIIANSSFSWWGAWLNNNPDKIVIAPNIWLNDDGTWGKRIVPEQWIKIKI